MGVIGSVEGSESDSIEVKEPDDVRRIGGGACDWAAER